MELALPKREKPESQFARVTKRLHDANDIPIGKSSDNPILNTRMYKVEYADCEKYAFSANVIAENMFTQIDEEGNHHVLMEKITDYRFDEAVVKSHDAFVTPSFGTKHRRQTTQGVSLCIKWRNGNTTWMTLKDIKEAHPVKLLEYTVSGKISADPAFDWWVPNTLKNRNHIIAKVKSKYCLKTHKFGIKFPKNMKQAIEFDRENRNTLWWYAVCQEMKNVHPAFDPW